MTTYPPTFDQKAIVDLNNLYQRVKTLENQMAAAVGAYAAFACTSSTHPAEPQTGMQIFETDTALFAIWSGSAWVYPPQLVGEQVLTSAQASMTVNVPSGVFRHLHGVFSVRQDSGAGGAFCFIQFNGDTGNHYVFQDVLGNGSTASAANNGGSTNGLRVGVATCSGDTANYFGTGGFEVGNISSSVFKPVSSQFTASVTTSNGYAGVYGGLWASTASITSVTLLPNSGNFVAGSCFTVVGWP